MLIGLLILITKILVIGLTNHLFLLYNPQNSSIRVLSFLHVIHIYFHTATETCDIITILNLFYYFYTLLFLSQLTLLITFNILCFSSGFWPYCTLLYQLCFPFNSFLLMTSVQIQSTTHRTHIFSSFHIFLPSC